MIRNLYHGSPTRNINLLKPKCFTSRDTKEGKLFFASPLISIASCFMLSWNDTWVSLLTNEGKVYLTTSNITRLEDSDRGGSIYLLSSKGFQFNNCKGIGRYEYYTTDPQIPMKESFYLSSLAAMCSHGVKITSLTPENFLNFKNSHFSEKLSMLNKLPAKHYTFTE